MRLVKDLHNHRIIYYWIDDSDVKLSPDLASLELAEEWRLVHMHESYQGWNRRTSHLDRRRHQHKRNQQALDRGGMNLISSGRRKADRSAKVDVDRAKSKLAALFSEYQPENDDTDASKQFGTS